MFRKVIITQRTGITKEEQKKHTTVTPFLQIVKQKNCTEAVDKKRLAT